MRVVGTFVLLLVTLAMAGWAYNENYKTRAALERVSRLQKDIGVQSEMLRRLEAEWAHLNRPERLAAMADANFESLGLVPLTYERYRHIREIPVTNSDPSDRLALDTAQ